MSEGVTDNTINEQQQVEQEALAKYNESKVKSKEQATGVTDGVPDGYNQDGTPIDNDTTTTTSEEPILGKFKSQEDLIKAYQELEKKLGSTDTNSTPDSIKQKDTIDDKTSDIPKPSFEKFNKEVLDNGELSTDSYKELENFGFNKEEVDRYIAGQKALVTQYTNDIYNTVGGKDNYTEIVTWAVDNIPEATITEYNTALGKGDASKVSQLLEYMAMKKGTNVEKTPTRLEGESISEGGGMKAFTDKSEWQRATANRLYGKDAKYTNMIDKRYLASKRKGTI